MFRRISLIAIALVFVALGAHSLNPRELLTEMYPPEPVKQDAFNICDEADPTFVRAVAADREACYNKMPHIMAVAMGRIKPGGALSLQALTDPSREAELLMTLAAIPPRQPITTPRSFSDTAWVLAMAPPCDDKRALPAMVYAPSASPALSPGTERPTALDTAIRNNLPPLPHAAEGGAAAPVNKAPVITLGPVAPPIGASSAGSSAKTAANPLSAPAPDIGDDGPPAIVPLAPASSCGGA